MDEPEKKKMKGNKNTQFTDGALASIYPILASSWKEWNSPIAKGGSKLNQKSPRQTVLERMIEALCINEELGDLTEGQISKRIANDIQRIKAEILAQKLHRNQTGGGASRKIRIWPFYLQDLEELIRNEDSVKGFENGFETGASGDSQKMSDDGLNNIYPSTPSFSTKKESQRQKQSGDNKVVFNSSTINQTREEILILERDCYKEKLEMQKMERRFREEEHQQTMEMLREKTKFYQRLNHGPQANEFATFNYEQPENDNL